MAKVLVIGEQLNGALSAATPKVVACAQALNPESIDVALFGAGDLAGAAEAAAKFAGVGKVLTVSNPANEHPLAAVLAPQIEALISEGGYTHVLASSSTTGKDVLPRVAAKLGVTQVTDIMAVHGANSFTRPTYAGNALVTVEVPEGQIVLGTVRGASWQAAEEGGSGAVESRELGVELPSHTRFVSQETSKSDRPDLQTAPKVVSGGRGVGSEENFKVIFSLADKLGAAVGASRAAVDAGYVPNEMQVGQTGKIIAPELYVAVGISGAIQHLAGIKDAGTIVAINKDEEAPIFEIADVGLVGDLFEVLPALEKELS
ncbi:MAG: electron transfer flavoprotein subunit alpha/FixB family protein [Pseudomonadota bacterium]|nr:electron transfer flavoprotein subunit alpha/FixB family protein [Pseudomonadota bacterium]